ncbi:hypothetical protein JHK87_027616 [Glycine soja]|nr:hypothetical protein JHK87_027616 [Glycine soja]
MKVLQPKHLNSMSQNQKTITHLKPPSLELLIIHEGQTIPVLPLDTSPPVTPVWHLTDEKNVPIQDNQDQVWLWLEAFAFVGSSRERKVQVPESFDRFCCVKICRDESSKRKPFREREMSLLQIVGNKDAVYRLQVSARDNNIGTISASMLKFAQKKLTFSKKQLVPLVAFPKEKGLQYAIDLVKPTPFIGKRLDAIVVFNVSEFLSESSKIPALRLPCE